jgi:uncharacterized membrane protein
MKMKSKPRKKKVALIIIIFDTILALLIALSFTPIFSHIGTFYVFWYRGDRVLMGGYYKNMYIRDITTRRIGLKLVYQFE